MTAEPPQTLHPTASVIALGLDVPQPIASGTQSICDFDSRVIAPCRSGEHFQTWAHPTTASTRAVVAPWGSIGRVIRQSAAGKDRICGLGTQMLQQPRCLLREQAAEGSSTIGSLQQQNAWDVAICRAGPNRFKVGDRET